MPTAQINGVSIYYEDTGGGGETVVFSHGLLWDTHLYDYQVAALRDRYRCVAYDHRGQGRSESPRTATIDMETLYADALALLEHLGIEKCHFVGLSMGGFVAMRLAIRRPELLHSIVLIATTPDPEAPDRRFPYWFFGQTARLGVFWISARFGMPYLFGPTFRNDPSRLAEYREWYHRLRNNRSTVYRAINGVVRREGVYEEIDRINVPTLILVGEEDSATSPTKSDRLHERIRGSTLVRIPNAGHTLTVEAPEAVNRELRAFLEKVGKAV